MKAIAASYSSVTWSRDPGQFGHYSISGKAQGNPEQGVDIYMTVEQARQVVSAFTDWLRAYDRGD